MPESNGDRAGRRLLGYARLARPANLPTAAADILAGVAVAGAVAGTAPGGGSALAPGVDLLCLVFASVFLYAGGVILNDVFDHRLDAVERPERPIPSGLIHLKSAALYGSAAMGIGVALAFLVHATAGSIAVALAAAIVLYDAAAKRSGFFGPLNMGVCRGLNLALGMSILGAFGHVWMTLIPVVYISAITLVSRGEVHGENRGHIVLAGTLYGAVVLAALTVAILYADFILSPILFLSLFGFLIFRPLLNAYSDNSPRNIKRAVMAGVLSLIVLDAALAASFSAWWYGLLVLALLPASVGLSKLFAVT